MSIFSHLVNACWPHVDRTCNPTLGAWRNLFGPFLSQTVWSYDSYSLRGVEKTIFFPTKEWWNNQLHLCYFLEKMTLARWFWVFLKKTCENRIWRWLFHHSFVGKKNMVFSAPRREYGSFDQTVWGKKGPNKFLQVPNVGLHVRWTCGQHALTKCEKMLKERWFLA